MNKAMPREIACAEAAAQPPSDAKDGSSKRAIAGSPIQPRASEASVMPSWFADKYEPRFWVILRARRARTSPPRTNCSSLVGRALTIANSAATKKPFASTSNVVTAK
jgi:hypothetical protein